MKPSLHIVLFGFFLFSVLPDALFAGPGDLQAPEEQVAPNPGPGPAITREMAEEKMGKPLDVSSFKDSDGREVEDWVYATGEWLRFVDGKLKSIGSTDWSPSLPKIRTDAFAM
jgi:hypothetical protein